MDYVERKTISYYNYNAEKYSEQTFNLDMTSLYNEFERFVPNNGKILDLGCGSGRDTIYFASKGYNVVTKSIFSTKKLQGVGWSVRNSISASLASTIAEIK